jgi:hypothetical protein
MKIRTGLALGATLAVLVVTVPLSAQLFGLLDVLPWETERTESSQPALLESLEDLSSYHAARGNYQVVVSIEEDSAIAPDFLAGEERTLLAAGSVDATVDFSTLSEDAIRVREDGSAVITLPTPELEDAHVDPERSEVVEHDRGLVNRVVGAVSEPTSIPESDLYALAGDELDDAATEAELQLRAEDNPREMLEGMLGELGYEDVTVRFEEPAPSV